MIFSSESYTLPIVVSTVLHGVLLFVIAHGWQATSPEKKSPIPVYVKATVVQMDMSAPKAQPKPKPRTIDRAAQQREREQQAREAARQQAQAQKAKEAKERKAQEERDKREREAAERRREEEIAWQQQLEQELNEALAEEEAQFQSEEDAELVMSYSDVIYSKVYQNWSYPPSTRRGMHCKVRVQLVPTGRVVNVTIIEKSGNTAFDRSAEQAIWQAEQFPELKDLPARVFEQSFREIILNFDPQDTRL